MIGSTSYESEWPSLLRRVQLPYASLQAAPPWDLPIVLGVSEASLGENPCVKEHWRASSVVYFRCERRVHLAWSSLSSLVRTGERQFYEVRFWLANPFRCAARVCVNSRLGAGAGEHACRHAYTYVTYICEGRRVSFLRCNDPVGTIEHEGVKSNTWPYLSTNGKSLV